MNFLEHRFTLDVRRDASKVCVRVRKGDTARRLRIALVQGVVPYEIRSDCYAMFSAVKPDGNRLFNPCTIEDNRIVYELTPQTTAVIGLVECEIRLYGADDALITSPGFDLIVDEVLYDEDRVPQSETEVNALTGLISDAAEVIAEGRELIGEFGSALGQIEGVRDEAEAAAEAAVAAAESAKTTAGEVAKQVQVAQDAATTAENANKGLDQKVAAAESARQSAETAAAEATEAESKAERALETALKTEERVLNAGSAAQSAANQAASDARTASVSASEAKQAAQNVESVRQAAVDAKERAEEAIASAVEATQDAAKATAAAEEMVRSVQEDRAAAETAARNAEQAANSINTQLAEDLDERVTQTEKEILNLKQGGLGDPGSAGTVEIVDVVDRPPGSPATLEETEGSTPEARKYILGVPGGVKGVGIKDTVVMDSPDGYTSVTISYTDGEEYTLTIPHGKDGTDYVLTDADKQEIAEMAAELVEVPEQDSSQNGDGLTGTEKTLILSLFRNAAYTADMSATFAQLEALWGGSGDEEPDVPDVPDEPDIPDVTLTSISATYNGGEVTAGTDVSALTDIVVVANYSDGTSKAVTDYTLSGEIAVGENTITVSYGGKTTTFVVTGVAESGGGDEPNDMLIARDTAITTAGSTDHWAAGYINDTGAVGELTNNYFYDEYLEAQGFTFLNSAGSPIGGQLRIAEYDENKAFISRALVSNNATYAIGANSTTFIKCGFGSGINRSSIHTIVPLIQMADLCTVENVTIDTTGAEVAYNGRNATEYISIADGMESFYVTAVGVPAIVALYDSDYALVNRIAVVSGASEQYISVPDNAAYIRICVGGDAVYTSLKFTAE